MAPETQRCPRRGFHRAGDRFLSAELKLKAPSRDLDQDLDPHQLLPQLVLPCVPSLFVFQGGGYFNAEPGTSPVTPPSAWAGTRLSSESCRGERDLLHLCSASEQREEGAGARRVQKDLVRCHGAGWELGAAGASLAREVLLRQLGLCRSGNKFSLAASPGGFWLLRQLGTEVPAPSTGPAGAGAAAGTAWAASGAQPRRAVAPVPVGGWRGRGGERAVGAPPVPNPPLGSTCHRLAGPGWDPRRVLPALPSDASLGRCCRQPGQAKRPRGPRFSPADLFPSLPPRRMSRLRSCLDTSGFLLGFKELFFFFLFYYSRTYQPSVGGV